MAEEVFISGIIAAGIRLSTPMLFAAIGEVLAERSGVRNLGIEGIMIMGAFSAMYTVAITGSLLLGLLAAIIVGALMTLFHAFMSITLKVNQSVSGITLSIFGLAFSTFLNSTIKWTQSSVIKNLQPTPIPILSQIPIIGPGLFQQDIFVYSMIIIGIVMTIFLSRTTTGLTVRAVGENPLAADSLGIRVERVRYLCTLLGGILAAIGGATLMLVYNAMFLPQMTYGRGWMAIAIVIFGRWNPLLVFGGGLMFGLLDSFQLRLQSIGFPIPTHFVLMFPYLVTLLVLVLVSRRARGPAGLGIPYEKGK